MEQKKAKATILFWDKKKNGTQSEDSELSSVGFLIGVSSNQGKHWELTMSEGKPFQGGLVDGFDQDPQESSTNKKSGSIAKALRELYLEEVP